MPGEQDVYKELDFLSDLISNRVRTISVGILAICWVFILQNISRQEGTSSVPVSALLVPTSLAILALIADFAQYLFGYFNINSARRKMEKNGLKEVKYDYHSLTYRMRIKMFYTKVVLMIGAAVWLLAILARIIFK